MPISATVMGTMFFNEHLTFTHIIGAAFVFSGILLNIYSKQENMVFSLNKKEANT